MPWHAITSNKESNIYPEHPETTVMRASEEMPFIDSCIYIYIIIYIYTLYKMHMHMILHIHEENIIAPKHRISSFYIMLPRFFTWSRQGRTRKPMDFLQMFPWNPHWIWPASVLGSMRILQVTDFSEGRARRSDVRISATTWSGMTGCHSFHRMKSGRSIVAIDRCRKSDEKRRSR